MKENIAITEPILTGDSVLWMVDIEGLEAMEDYQYTYYLIQNGNVVERVAYKNITKNKFEIEIELVESSAYKVQIFIKKNGNLLFNKYSTTAYVDLNTHKLLKPYFYKEEIYFNDIPVKYVFHPAESDYLVVCFSGISKREYQGKSPVYNYIRTLEDVAVNRLYILDSYEDHFCYYLGKNGKRDFEKSVLALITEIANNANIYAKNIITAGSSKGGTAALYYTLTYNYGLAIVGAPQIYISKFLKSFSKNKYIKAAYLQMLGNPTKQMEKYLDQLMFVRLSNYKNKSTLFFHVGRGDYHFESHLRPFLINCDLRKIDYELQIAEYSNHSETGSYFGPILKKKIQAYINERGS